MLSGLVRCRHPERARILIGSVTGSEFAQHRRRGRGFAVRQQHPAGEETFRIGDLAGRQVVRRIREARVDAHLAVVAEGGGKQRDAAFEGPVVAYPRSAGVPPVAVFILKRVAVSCAVNETAGLVTHGVVRSVFEGSQRAARDVGAGGIDVVLGAGRTDCRSSGRHAWSSRRLRCTSVCPRPCDPARTAPSHALFGSS